MKWLALDIGGANIKVADGAGFACSQPYALWLRPEGLPQELRTMIDEAPPCDHVAVTMTGELADCFATKTEGVWAILDAVAEAVGGRSTWIYQTDGSLVTPQQSREEPLLAAASNWHALACYASRFVDPGAALMIDIGSTTTDIIPIFDRQACPLGRDDTTRLIHGELVYTGVERSPICAVVRSAPYRGQTIDVAQEFFATMLDAYVTLGDFPERSESAHTADGRPADRPAAMARMARLVCADTPDFNYEDARNLAAAAADEQLQRLAMAIQHVAFRTEERCKSVVVSGVGEFLARRALAELDWETPVVSLSERLGAGISKCAPAHALAILAQERAS